MNSRELVWLRRARDLSQMLGSEEDTARVPPLILEAALKLTEAERAFLVRVEGPDTEGGYRFDVLATRGFVGNALAGPEGEISRTIVERALSNGGQTVCTTRPVDAEFLQATTLMGRGIRSLVCVPLRLRGALVGILYLDHRREEALFDEQDLPILQAFGTQAALALELTRDVQHPPSDGGSRHLVGKSPVIQTLRTEVERVSQTLDPVLICGEPGTECGLVAREIHDRTPAGEDPLRPRPFKTIACGAENDVALLLGTEGEPGFLATARTVCLEEVEGLSGELQRVLARGLREGQFTVPGSSRTLPLSARLIAVTAVDLHARVREGSFRADLYYRLDVQRLIVPPLRQRREDLAELCEALLARKGEALEIDSSALIAMGRYGWPGNLLELEGELRRLCSLKEASVSAEDLSQAVREGRGVSQVRADFCGQTLGEIEEEIIRSVLADCDGVRSRAARQLGVPRSTLYHLMERHGIE